MSKRMLAASLWFAATWFGYEIVWSLTGAPRLVGPVVAFIVAAAVTIDPLHALWPRAAASARDTSQTASVARIPT